MENERKVVLITGGSRGLGAKCAIEFAKRNYDIVINYKENETCALALKEMLEKEYNINVLCIKSDISNEEDVKLMIKEIIKTFYHINVLVNNAGISMDNNFTMKDSEEFKEVLNTNLVGTFLVSKYVAKEMLDGKKGTIINISSNNAIGANYEESMDYDASKAGIISLTHNFALALKPYVRVNCVCPGWMDTDMNKDIDETFRKAEESKIYLERFADPAEVAKVVYFLASSDASYINNSIIKVDGGTNG